MRRTLFRMRLPLALFIMIILILCGASIAIFYSAFISHVRGDNFRLETRYIDVDYPISWYAAPWENKNASGNTYNIVLVPPNFQASMFFIIYDEAATKTYLEKYNVTDASSVTLTEVKRLQGWILEKNASALIHYIANGSRTVLGHEAVFSTFMVEGGYINEEGRPQNWTWTFMSFIDGRMFQIAYHGVAEDYDRAYESFQIILNSAKIK